MSKVIIIGAGPAGLTAAYELNKSGLNANILEADNQVGGISRTVNYQGFRFDIGGHRFFTKVDYIQQLWQEILGEEFLQRSRLSRIYYDDNFYNYPLKMGNTLANLGVAESFLVAMSYLRTRLQPYPNEQNLEEWVSNRFGHRLYRIFFKTYTEKVWGIPCSEISADWAMQRIKNLSLTEALRNALLTSGQTRSGEIITSLIEKFHYPRFGPGMMWEACASKLASSGSQTILEHRVDKLKHKNGRVNHIIARTHNGEMVEMEVDQIISSMPLRELIQALDPAPPDSIVQAACQLRYRDYLTVVLVVERQHVFPDNWIYIHAPQVKLGRVQNYKNWSPEMVPDPALTSLGLEYFLWEKDEEWRWSDERLISLGISEAVKIGLVRVEEVRDGTVVRMKKAYPVYDQNYQQSLQLLREYLGTFSNLQSIGRNGLHRYNNQDHSMLTGVYAARNMTGDKKDVWEVNTEQSYHEAGENGKAGVNDRFYPVGVSFDEKQSAELLEKMLENALAPLHATALGLAGGLVAGMVVALATTFLLLKSSERVGSYLILLSEYLWGYRVSWKGALIGFIEAGAIGFGLGYIFATLRNWGVAAYVALVKYPED